MDRTSPFYNFHQASIPPHTQLLLIFEIADAFSRSRAVRFGDRRPFSGNSTIKQGTKAWASSYKVQTVLIARGYHIPLVALLTQSIRGQFDLAGGDILPHEYLPRLFALLCIVSNWIRPSYVDPSQKVAGGVRLKADRNLFFSIKSIINTVSLSFFCWNIDSSSIGCDL